MTDTEIARRRSVAGAASAPRRIAIAAPHRLGDCIAHLTLAGAVKRAWPASEVYFIGLPYTRALIERSRHVHAYVDAGDVLADPAVLSRLQIDTVLNPFPHMPLAYAAKDAGVATRVGNLRRPRMLFLCNRFVWVSRVHGGLHEVESTLRNLRGLGLSDQIPRDQWHDLIGLVRPARIPDALRDLIAMDRFNLILHPKSGREGREWPAAHFAELARLLPAGRFRLLVTGTAAEGAQIGAEAPELLAQRHVVDATGRLDMPGFLDLLMLTDGIVASGTGPLHVAAASGRHALGIYPPRQGIDPARWSPVGVRAEYLCRAGRCEPTPSCPQKFDGGPCDCMRAVSPAQVADRVNTWLAMGQDDDVPAAPAADAATEDAGRAALHADPVG
jgi:ADP-heptose:LPS heptosyltransferase